MSLPNNFKSTNKENHFYFVDSFEKYNTSYEEVCKLHHRLIEICDLFKISIEEISKILKECRYLPKDIAEFSSGRYGILAEKGGIYTEKYDTFLEKWIPEFHDVYITVNSYVSFNKVIEYLFKVNFKNIYENELFKEIVPRFEKPFEIQGIIDGDTEVDDLQYLTNNYGFKCSDIVKMLTDPSYGKSNVQKSKFKFYDTDQFYLDLQPRLVNGHYFDQSLYIPFKAFMNKDWKSIENLQVYSIPKENGTFFNGKQKNSPYFNDPIILKFKELFLNQ